MENNSFHLVGHTGPYHLYLSKEARHLLFEIKSIEDTLINSFYLALGPFRKLIRDYNQICESYYDAIRTKGVIIIAGLKDVYSEKTSGNTVK